MPSNKHIIALIQNLDLHQTSSSFFQARPLLGHAIANEEFDGLVDPRLERNYDESEMFRMIEAAAACVRHLAAKRPKMGQVIII